MPIKPKYTPKSSKIGRVFFCRGAVLHLAMTKLLFPSCLAYKT